MLNKKQSIIFGTVLISLGFFFIILGYSIKFIFKTFALEQGGYIWEDITQNITLLTYFCMIMFIISSILIVGGIVGSYFFYSIKGHEKPRTISLSYMGFVFLFIGVISSLGIGMDIRTSDVNLFIFSSLASIFFISSIFIIIVGYFLLTEFIK